MAYGFKNIAPLIAKPHKFKSLVSATRTANDYRRQLEWYKIALGIAVNHRRELAKLAAERPCFFNPLVIYDAKTIRDEILREECGLTPNGEPIKSL